MKKLIKCDMIVQTADALRTAECVLDAVPRQEVAEIRFFGDKRSEVCGGKFNESHLGKEFRFVWWSSSS